MSDALSPVTLTRAGEPPAALGPSALSLEDYARVVQARSEFVDFLLAPVRDRLAAAA